MKIISLSSRLSTFVTRWAFKPSCFLINVSMSTSVLFLSLVCLETTTKGYRTRGALSSFQLMGLKAFNTNYTFGIGTDFVSTHLCHYATLRFIQIGLNAAKNLLKFFER